MRLQTILSLMILSLAFLQCNSFLAKIKNRQAISINAINNGNEYTEKDKITGIAKRSTLVAIGGLLGFMSKNKVIADSNNKITVQPLPYDYNALEPHISSNTMKFHHDKHYSKYVATTNQLIENTDLANADLVTIMKESHNKNQQLFNAASQSWNHEFYWKCMQPNGGSSLPPKIMKLVNKSFGSYDEFRRQFVAASNSLFGSGWVWLTQNSKGDLEIIKTANAENPLIDGKKPILTIDIWEHAYYLDYQNVRATYVDAFVDNLIDWKFVEKQLS